MEEQKYPCHTDVLSDSEVSKSKSWNITSFRKTTLLPITRYHVRFYANNYLEYLPIVSTALKLG